MGQLARLRQHPGGSSSTRELANLVGLPVSTVSKILKTLVRSGLCSSRRGANGGYALARRPDQITVMEIVRAIEGPLTVTQGGVDDPSCCPIGTNWRLIDSAVRSALSGVTLRQMTVQFSAAAPHEPNPNGDEE